VAVRGSAEAVQWLTYHQARNVRFLIKGGHLEHGQFASFVSLPRNREEAWATLAVARRDAAASGTVSGAIRVFDARFEASLEHLSELYDHGAWRHSSLGGNAWAAIARAVISLRDALEGRDAASAGELIAAITMMRHNTGHVGDKLRTLNAWAFL
jgi:hypothetical protein